MKALNATHVLVRATQVAFALALPLLRGHANPRMYVDIDLLRNGQLIGDALTAAADASDRPLANAQDYGAPSAIPPQAIMAQRDLGVLMRVNAEDWLPPSPEQIAARRAEPEDAGMRESFAVWLETLLSREWLPRDVVRSAPYLKCGTGGESRRFSEFYAAYQLHGSSVMIKGRLSELYVIIFPVSPEPPPSLAPAFAEARAWQEGIPPGRLGVPASASEAASTAVLPYLRMLAATYLNPACLPTEAEWEAEPRYVHMHNGGFRTAWHTRAYGDYLPPAEHPFPDEPALVSVWTNGRAARLYMGMPFPINPFPNLLAAMPTPVRAPVSPLNPDAVDLWDQREWYDDGGGNVSQEERAASTVIRVVVHQPYAPSMGSNWEFEETGGQPFWGNQVFVPMTELKWRIAEFAALASATELNIVHYGCREPDGLGRQLSQSADRALRLAQAKAVRDSLEGVAGRFGALRYPREVKAERDALLEALRASVRAWDMAIPFWEPVVRDHPDAPREFWLQRQGELAENLAAAGLSDTAERIGEAGDVGVPLFQRFGLQ